MPLEISGIEISLYSGESEIPVYDAKLSGPRKMTAYLPSEVGQVRRSVNIMT